ncbi:protein hunchback-like [Cataglyphis hispanica]|uniref:protein hunchback-like n=1 Tax=Cataglyphis hispanica TaxID=1086592 RepID=UPI00217FEFFB|nr:protein hunchback-like [Cataglyphis hispanica]XP_050460022.1 protein hunchback-like [Cataglyphis hispanica]XP_050460023.1 protein hunchback-like [Cataglyphis hispanica]
MMNYNLSPTSKNSLQLVYENSNLPEEVTQHQDMNKYQVNQSDIMSNIMKPSSEDINLTENTLQCPICIFITSNRSKFIEHLISHCTSKCNNPNFKAILAQLPIFKFLEGETNYSFPTLEDYIAHETEEIDKSKLSQSNVNQRQNKSFREGKTCKQCNFVASTKMEYWEHMRCHIKGFTCSQCSFVTKYKHHMNHHWLSVHDGSKPFKCKKCSYTCVSKSMLTSHLKKHSDVYPYRCANCTYKTKFCNALKKHLRKKNHQPAMVLNADGSPNPFSIIDVYGTKRGPKQKPPAEKQDELNQSTDQSMTIDNSQLNLAPTSPILPLQSPVAHYLTLTTVNEINNANSIMQNNMKQNQSVVTFPYNDLVAAFNLSNHLLLREDAKFHENVHEINHAHANTLECIKIMKMPEEYIQHLPLTCLNENDANKLHISDNVNTSESSTFVTLKTQLKSQKDESTDAPLDLRIAEVNEKNQFQLKLLTTNSHKIIGTNKRKGRAMKLERRAMEENTRPKQKEMEYPKSSTINEPIFREENQNIKDSKGKAIIDSIDIEHICHYCEITFGNVVMYTMHMGCHGFDDPYTCNMCGHHCTDKLSFFLHIAQSQHT